MRRPAPTTAWVKRWQNSVGRPELQAFYGALAGQKAKKGVFITTSGFTAQALDFAKSVDGIVLVDGTRLAGLMIDHEVGISSRTIRIPKIDGDLAAPSAATRTVGKARSKGVCASRQLAQ